MAELRHISMSVPDVEAAAKFYEDSFELERVKTTDTSIWLSDGTINFVLTPTSNFDGTDMEGFIGIDHFGFVVKDKDTAKQKITDNGGRAAEGKCYDPNGVMVNVNDKYWLGSK
jgi:catechol 2,3-dioxygenase-like lactoylglutathione lyase family enzyme